MDQISPTVLTGIVMTLLSALLCLAWGIRKWNRAGGADEPLAEIAKWATEEEETKRI
ncbi:MAG: hypothetical protein R6X19_09935 [Kiritimatiellia bacterium]